MGGFFFEFEAIRTPRCSAQARELTNDARLAIIKYFSVVSGNENQAKKTQLSSPLHPSLERAYRLLEPLFVEHVIGENGQGLLSSPERWETLLKTLPEEIGGQISKPVSYTHLRAHET